MGESKLTGKFKPGRGYEVIDSDGKRNWRFMVVRPITDPEWNRQQMGTHVRMSKKERLKARRGQK